MLTAGSDHLKGSLGDFSPADIIQLISLGGKSGRLSLMDGSAGEGSLFFEYGYIVHASWNGIEGEEAARSLVTAESGKFLFSPGKPAERKTMMLSGHELLMRTAHSIDEMAFLQDDAQLELEIETSGDSTVAQARERVRDLLLDRLGRKSAQPLAALDRNGETMDGLVEACERIERYIALFIDEARAESIGRELREAVGIW